MSHGAEQSADRKVARIGLVAPVQHANPYDAIDFNTAVICDQIFDTPYSATEAGSHPQPLLFDAPLTFVSPTRARARLRAGLKFSDGSPVAASDVQRSLRRMWGPLNDVEVHARAGLEVEFELERPSRMLAAELAKPWAAISTERGGETLGTGAYRLVAHEADGSCRLDRNAHYHGLRGSAPIDELRFEIHPADETGAFGPLLRAVERGEVDFTSALSRDDVRHVTGVRKLFQPGSSTSILFFNTERPGLDDPRVRSALVRSMDRYRLAATCFENPAGFVARCLLPPRMSNYADGINYDQSATEGVSLEALPRPLRLVVIWGPRPYNPAPKAVAEEIRGQLARIGLETELVCPEDSDRYFERVLAGDYDLVLSGWIADTSDAADFLESMLHSKSVPLRDAPSATAVNLSRWRDTAVDALLAQLREGGTTEVQAKILDRVRDQAPLLPLAYGPSFTVVSRRLENYEPSVLGLFPLFSELDIASGG
jgi:ABC-type transport system substrate-binding protein